MIKSFDELIHEIKNYYDIKTEICIDKKQMLIFAKIKT